MKEVYKTIKGFPGYKISNLGTIVHVRTGNQVKGSVGQIKGKSAYIVITLYAYPGSKEKKIRLHRLLAEHFIPNPNDLSCVNHKDGNKLNNALDNLEWTTYSKNNKHAYKTGLKKPVSMSGEKNGMAKLTMKHARIIRIEYATVRISQRALAKRYEVHHKVINLIVNNKSYVEKEIL